MIILNSYYSSVHDLAYELYTKPRSSTARAFAKDKSSRLCPYCGQNESADKSRHARACKECDARLSRMLTTKNRIIHGNMGIEALLRLKQDYKQLDYVPYMLAGRSGDVTKIESAIDRCIDEYIKAEQLLREEAMRCSDVSFAELQKKLRTLTGTHSVPDATECLRK